MKDTDAKVRLVVHRRRQSSLLRLVWLALVVVPLIDSIVPDEPMQRPANHFSYLDNERQPVWANGVAMSMRAAPNIGQLKAVGST